MWRTSQIDLWIAMARTLWATRKMAGSPSLCRVKYDNPVLFMRAWITWRSCEVFLMAGTARRQPVSMSKATKYMPLYVWSSDSASWAAPEKW